MMKTIVLSAAILAFANFAQAAVLQVNLGPSGLPTETGFTDWTTDGDPAAPAPIMVNGIGLSLTVQSSDQGSNIRSIDRGGNDGYAGTLADLTQSWWGVRATSTGSGGQFTIIVNGANLGAGDFDWTSWHHDHEDQSGVMDIDYSVNGGSTFTLGVNDLDIVGGTTDGNTNAPNPGTFSFTSNGTDDIHIRFTNVVSTNSGEAFALLNGFQIDAIPEPSSAMLLGLAGLSFVIRRRR